MAKSRRAYLVACEWITVIFMAYHTVVWGVQFDGMAWQVGVFLVRGNEEECRILARGDTIHLH